ncbi:hypothetical protein PO909_033158, partial [Leuciscus waleckii]
SFQHSAVKQLLQVDRWKSFTEKGYCTGDLRKAEIAVYALRFTYEFTSEEGHQKTPGYLIKTGYWQIFSLYGDHKTLIGNVMSFKQSFPLILLKNMNFLYEQDSVGYSFILTRNLLAAHVLFKIRGILLWNRNVRLHKLPVKHAIFHSLLSSAF